MKSAGLVAGLALITSLGLPPAGGPGPAGSDTPHRDLANKSLKLTVLLPDPAKGYYRGARFDWSGIVSRVEFGGHSLFAPWKTPHKPDDPEGALGTAEEFGMFEPLGYADARPGGTFVKIGVGVLEKAKDEKYGFWNAYKIVKPGAWQVTDGDGWVEFRQDLASEGYGYRYVKRVALDKDAPAFTVRHTLRNTGTKPIRSDNYCHNFLVFDDDPVGPSYSLRFAFPARAKDEKGLNGLAEVKDGRWAYRKELTRDSAYSELLGLTGKASDNRVEAEDAKAGVGVRIAGDTPVKKYNVWSVRTALCPEPFIELDLAPDAETSWSTRYELYEVGKGR